MNVHPIILAAAGGEPPSWAVVSPARLAHMRRVADLMRSWAETLDLSKKKRVRWAAAGLLHDALRNEDPERLREHVHLRFQDLPGPILHGPAAAERLRKDGVEDEPLLAAVAFHTLGDPVLGRMGRALCCADNLETGRSSRRDYRDDLLSRMPHDMDNVLYEIFRRRLENLRRRGGYITDGTLAFFKELEGRRG